MKDTLITAKQKKTELITLLVCFILANLLNAYAIIAYDTYFKELFTQLGYVLIFSIGLYLLWTFLRIIYFLIKKLFKTKKS